MSAGDDDVGVRFSLSFWARASSSAACFRRFFADFGRERRLERLVDDFVFLGLSGLGWVALDAFSDSFPCSPFREIVLNVFLCNDLKPSSLVFGRFDSFDFLGDSGA